MLFFFNNRYFLGTAEPINYILDTYAPIPILVSGSIL